MSELVRQRLSIEQVTERVAQEVERSDLVAALRQAQAQLKEAEEEARGAKEAAAGARCEETGYAKAAEKARASQEAERRKMEQLEAALGGGGGVMRCKSPRRGSPRRRQMWGRRRWVWSMRRQSC